MLSLGKWKDLLLAIALVLPSFVAADGKIKIKLSDLKLKQGLYHLDGRLFTGSVLDYGKALHPFAIVPVVKGRISGTKKYLFGNGSMVKLRGAQSFRNGVADGPYVFFSLTGHITRMGHTKNGKLSGWCYEYYPDGTTKKKEHYVTGLLSGESKYYHQDGTVDEIINYKEGKYHGLSRKFNRNGKVMEMIEMEDGHVIKKTVWQNGKYVVTVTEKEGRSWKDGPEGWKKGKDIGVEEEPDEF